jgi:hypothetical protein
VLNRVGCVKVISVRCRLLFALLCLMLMLAHRALAAVLPLGGYFRPGECIPVDVAGAEIELTGQGIVPVRSQGTAIVPVLILEESKTTLLSSRGDRFPLQPLSPDQRLVGVADGQLQALAPRLFPEQTVVTVQLSATNPILGPATAWGALDAVLLRWPTDPEQIDALLAQGIIIVTNVPRRPDNVRPWQQEQGVWILRPGAGAWRGAVGGGIAYEPTDALQLLQPPALRRRIMLAGVLVSLLMLASLLPTRRHAIITVVVIGVLSLLVLEIWRRAQPVVRTFAGDVVVRSNLPQRDRWQYQLALRDTPAAMGSDGRTLPVVLSAAHAQRIGLRLDAKDAELTWRYTLKRSAKMAFVTRTIDRSPPAPNQADLLSPLDALAGALYGNGLRVQAHLPPAPDLPADVIWPSVILAPGAPATQPNLIDPASAPVYQ